MAEAGHDFCAPQAAMVHRHPESIPAQGLPCTRPEPSGLDVTLGNTLTQKPAGGSGSWRGETRLQTPSGGGGGSAGPRLEPGTGSRPLWFLRASLHQGPWRRRRTAPLVASGGGTHGRHCLHPAVFVFQRYCCWSMKGQNHLESSEFPALREFLIENLLFWRTVTSPGLPRPGGGRLGGLSLQEILRWPQSLWDDPRASEKPPVHLTVHWAQPGCHLSTHDGALVYRVATCGRLPGGGDAGAETCWTGWGAEDRAAAFLRATQDAPGPGPPRPS